MSVGTRWSSNVGISLVVIAAVGALGAEQAGAQTAITTCGQEVESGDAYLVGDLDCPDGTEGAVEFTSNGSHLDMRGFTIRGGEYGVFCAHELPKTAPNGEHFVRYLTCSVSNGTLLDQTEAGVDARNLELTDVTIASTVPGWFGIIAHKKLRFINVSIQSTLGSFGISGAETLRMEGTNLSITNANVAISRTKKVRVDGMTVTGSVYQAIIAATVNLANATVTGGTIGISALKANVVDSTITGCSDIGVRAGRRLKVSGSTVTGNTLDLYSESKPEVENTTCDTSNGWGVCAND